MKKTTHIQQLFDNINGGDCVDSAAEAQEICERLLRAAKMVVACWEHGDHAGSVNSLAIAIEIAEGK